MLVYFVSHLKRISDNSHINQMTQSNLITSLFGMDPHGRAYLIMLKHYGSVFDFTNDQLPENDLFEHLHSRIKARTKAITQIIKSPRVDKRKTTPMTEDPVEEPITTTAHDHQRLIKTPRLKAPCANPIVVNKEPELPSSPLQENDTQNNEERENFINVELSAFDYANTNNPRIRVLFSTKQSISTPSVGRRNRSETLGVRGSSKRIENVKIRLQECGTQRVSTSPSDTGGIRRGTVFHTVDKFEKR
ncbi:ABCB20 [Acrasis kona]